MMSWNLRLYFVVTEYLIKRDFLDLFPGITMKDSLNEVQKKLINASQGQASDTHWCYTNHIDYEKWNNHQRYESTAPVFKVMGQFYGLPRLFERTHLFFQECFVYFADRVDLLAWDGEKIVNVSDILTSWYGQLGGLEGLRQKGWTLVSMLVIEREGKTRNTHLIVLAQGDNQAITTFYKKGNYTDIKDIRADAMNAYQNNQRLMDNLRSGITHLGLIINEDKTIISSEYLNYGKLITLWENRIPVETKRYSRSTGCTNDQIPGVGPVLSSVGTICLTVAQASESILEPMVMYAHIGVMCLTLLCHHDPAARLGLSHLLDDKSPDLVRSWWVKNLFLDPALGGIGGMSLNRFLIRGFPDPVTEGLSFAKNVCSQLKDKGLIEIVCSFGFPSLKRFTHLDLKKLLENPSSLNLKHGLSGPNLIREHIRGALIQNAHTYENDLFRVSFMHLFEEEITFLSFASSCKPCFPQFLSELRAASLLHIADLMLGLFVGANSVKNKFKRHFREDMAILLVKSEVSGVLSLCAPIPSTTMWDCSSSYADLLREKSWGEPVVGTTIPHPSELIRDLQRGIPFCTRCPSGDREYVTASFPGGISQNLSEHGKLSPYLGTRTSEMSAFYNHWEKETSSHLIKNAVSMRRVLNWFVSPTGNLAESIFEMLRCHTGEDWSQGGLEVSRTGSPIHRFKNSRTSDGGYTATSPNLLTYVMVTTDTLGTINRINHDFIYQSLLLYSQQASIERAIQLNTSETCHFHISCRTCLRVIDDVNVESGVVYRPVKDWSEVINKMGYDSTADTRLEKMPPLREVDWTNSTSEDVSYKVEFAQGAAFSILKSEGSSGVYDSDLFPKTLAEKIIPRAYLRGLLCGLRVGAALDCWFKRSINDLRRPKRVMTGATSTLIESLSSLDALHVYLEDTGFKEEVRRKSGHLSASYPSQKRDGTRMLMDYLSNSLTEDLLTGSFSTRKGRRLILFSDFRSPRNSVLTVVGWKAAQVLSHDTVSGEMMTSLHSLKHCASYYSARIPGRGTINEPKIYLPTRIFANFELLLYFNKS